nr:hypothetical protein GCM10020092_007320 [Actinoplanes digitatis]
MRWGVHHANHYYGHAHVLARYCGLDDADPPRLHGYLQHGWNIGDGLAADHEFVAGTPVLLWSERTRRRAWSLGWRETYVVGSPWAYLLRMEKDPGVRREGTIWYPFHGWEGQHVLGDHARLIEQIRDTEPGPVTVCLYWQEYRTASVRRRYERAGFPGDLPRLPRRQVGAPRPAVPPAPGRRAALGTAGSRPTACAARSSTAPWLAASPRCTATRCSLTARTSRSAGRSGSGGNGRSCTVRSSTRTRRGRPPSPNLAPTACSRRPN